MKQSKLLTSIYLFFLSFGVFAQIPPNAFNYSAVARGPQGQPIASQNIGIRISILKSSVNGTIQYIENHQTTTDPFGLFNLRIGLGTVQSGNFNSIDWGGDNYFLKVELDAQGGINYFNMGTTQFFSVPYALYAKSAGSINNGGSVGNFSHYIGEEYGGGVIFHLWKDGQGIEHGLIVDLVDLSTSHIWSNNEQNLIGPSAGSYWDGLSNSNAITNQSGHISSAASLCLNSTNGGQSDWYLPSIDELSILSQNRFNINKSLSSIPIANSLTYLANYWTSTESSNQSAWSYTIFNGMQNNNSDANKGNQYYVRAIRAF